MDNGVLFVLAAMLLCWSKGCSQTMSNNILSKTEVEAGGSFTVTCDASRAAVPADASIGSVLVQLNNGSEKIVVAKYWTFAPILSVRDPSRIFPVRNWTYNFDGSLRGTADRPKNRNTMRIEIYAVDAKCQDAGSYFCIVEYLVGTSNTLITKESYQTLVVKDRFVPMPISIYPQFKVGHGTQASCVVRAKIVKLNCTVKGSFNVSLRWKFGNSLSNFRSFTSYPVEVRNKKKLDGPVLVDSGTTCVHYLNSSTLEFNPIDDYDGYVYVCIATENNIDTIVGNMTIFTDIGPVGHVNSEANIDLISDALVGPTVVEQGGLFILQCDPSIAGITSTDENLYTLYIEWTNGTSKLQELASYNSIEPPYTSQNPPKTYPARKWSFKFSGGLDDRSSNFFQKNSKKLKKIEISVYDANCADAGFYFCRADLPYAGDYFMRHHNLTVVGRAIPVSLTINPHNVKGRKPNESVNPAGSSVNLTCIVNGPKNITFQWRYGNKSSNFVPYPVKSDISVAEPVLVSSGPTCVQYLHSSTLKFQSEDMYDGYTYVCVATENNRDLIVGNVIIYTKK